MHATPKVFVALPLVALVALVLLGGLVAVVMLLANPKTRMAGAVLVLILVGLVVSGGIGLLAVARHAAEREAVLSRNASEMAQEVARHAAEREATPGALLPSPPTAGHVAAETVLNHWVNELPTPATAGEVAAKPQAATEQSEGVLRAVWKAVGKAVADTKKQEKIAAGSSTAKPPATGPDEDKPTVARRPDWVDTQPGPVGGVYQMAVRVDPHPTQQEGENALPEALHKAVSQYVATGLKYQPRIARRVRLPLAYIRQNIVKETWPEPVHITYGTWVQMHVLLQFDHQAKQRIQQECDKLIVAERLWYTGGGVAAVLAVLSLVFAGLKIDQATKGTCRGRLSLAGVVAVLAVLGGGYYGLHSLWAYPVTPHPAPPAVKPIEPASGAASERTEGSAPGVPTAAVNVQGRPATWVVLLPISALVLVGIALLVNRKSRVAVLAALALAAVVFVSALLVHLPKGAPGMHIRPGPTELIILGVVAIPMLIATITSSNRWAWILGYLVCFVVPALFTPADPASMLLLAVPLCCIFSLAVLAWKVPAKDAHEKALRRDPASPPAEQ